MNFYLLLLVVTCVADFVPENILYKKTPATLWKTTWKMVGKCNPSWDLESIFGAGERYSTCNEKRKNKRNACTLLTDYIKFDNNINIIFVNLIGSGINCSSIHYKCSGKYIFKLYTGDAIGSDNVATYKSISMVPIDIPSSSNFYSYNDTFSINVAESTGMRLGFRTTYFCGSITSLKLFYYNCPIYSKVLAMFDLYRGLPHRSPSMQNSPLRINGTCVNNSQPMGNVYMECYYNGRYDVIGGCICKKGFEKYNSECKACIVDKYKANDGDEKCKRCGKNSQSKNTGGISCYCNVKHFRELGKENMDEAPCYRPPDPPTAIHATAISRFQARIHWRSADNVGDDPLGIYVIHCNNCPPNQTFHLNTSHTYVNITGLRTMTTYIITVVKRNNVTKMVGKSFSAMFTFTTKAGGKPGIIRNFEYVTNQDSSVTLLWDAPFNKGSGDLTYFITYGSKDVQTTQPVFTIQQGPRDETYDIQIYVQATFNGKVYRGDMYTHKVPIFVAGRRSFTFYAGVSIGAGIIFIALIVVVTSLIMKRRRVNKPGETYEMDQLDALLPVYFKPEFNRHYVDPVMYLNINSAMYIVTRELNRNNVILDERLGTGVFGDVFRGTYTEKGEGGTVAVKTLTGGSSQLDRDDFLTEAATLGQFSNPNVLSLKGVVSNESPFFIVFEFMKHGALNKYLQQYDTQLDLAGLLRMTRCVASGMTYLSEMGYVHKDLAGRNILVGENNICKIAEFGVRRNVKISDVSESEEERLKWMAPEAVKDFQFSSTTDVWSFGVLIWEVMSHGRKPYFEWNIDSVIGKLNNGYRLPAPEDCRPSVHNMMLQCWAADPSKRPGFHQILETVKRWLQYPTTLEEDVEEIENTEKGRIIGPAHIGGGFNLCTIQTAMSSSRRPSEA